MMRLVRLPKQLDGDPRAPALAERLANGRLLWPGGAIAVADVPLDDGLARVLADAHAQGCALRGLERATAALDAQERGLARADRNAGVARGERISRLLLLADDGADRFYRHVESLVRRHAARVIAVRLDVDSAVLGARVFGAGATAKLVMLDRKDVVAAALRAIADGAGGSEPGRAS
jgi:hypothetical protein